MPARSSRRRSTRARRATAPTSRRRSIRPIPKLAGQHQDYLRASLLAYQKGDHPTFGRNNAVMGAQAKPLSAREIDDIAAYLASLPPSLVVKL